MNGFHWSGTEIIRFLVKKFDEIKVELKIIKDDIKKIKENEKKTIN